MVMREAAGLSTSYTITHVSKDPVATIVLFGDQAKQFMRALWYNIFLSFICLKKRDDIRSVFVFQIHGEILNNLNYLPLWRLCPTQLLLCSNQLMQT